jgi:tetratricopeptide (TPR) repeat protein
MRYEFQKIRCQRCRAVNPLGQELCDQCGTRLMLVVEPTGLRYEEEQSAEVMPPALMLERMTILETGLNRFAEKLERGFELMLRQAENIHREHLLVESLIFTLVQSGVITREELDRLWKEAQERNEADRREAARREELRKQIIADPPDADDERTLFYQHVGEGFAEITAGAFESGIKKLERASIFSGNNFALNAYIAEQHFRDGKSALARDYLLRCLTHKEDDPRLLLMFGISLADEGTQLEVGRFHIEEAQKRQPSYAGHYALGRLAALEDDWKKARKEFGAALKLRNCAESNYICALAHFETRGEEWHEKMALRYVRKAITRDPEYREAHLLLGLLYRRSNDKVRARESFARATASLKARRAATNGERLPRFDSERALLIIFFGESQLTGTRLLNDGDQRLARLMREDALALSPPAL